MRKLLQNIGRVLTVIWARMTAVEGARRAETRACFEDRADGIYRWTRQRWKEREEPRVPPRALA